MKLKPKFENFEATTLP